MSTSPRLRSRTVRGLAVVCVGVAGLAVPPTSASATSSSCVQPGHRKDCIVLEQKPLRLGPGPECPMCTSSLARLMEQLVNPVVLQGGQLSAAKVAAAGR